MVGAGPAGSATAIRLACAGHAVLLMDRARFPRDKPCSEYLHPGTVDALARLGGGILERLERAPHARLRGVQVVASDGCATAGRYPDGRTALALPRTALDAALRDAAETAGAVVLERTTAEDLLYERGAVAGVVARAEDGRRDALRARVVVGADGLRSVVARRLGVRSAAPPRRVAFAAHVADVADVGDLGEMHVGAEGYVGLGPIGGGVTTVALVVPERAVRARRGDQRARFFEELDRFPRVRGRFDSRRLVRPVLAVGPLAWRSRPVIAPGGGAVLVGDAADFFDPFAGQGIFAALRDAELAAGCLIPALSRGVSQILPAPALWAYARARRAAFARTWLLERLIGLGVGWRALGDRMIHRLARRPELADLLLGAAGHLEPARAVLAPGALARLLL